MAKQTFPMHLYAQERINFDAATFDAMPTEVRFTLQPYADMNFGGVYVGPVDVEAEVPDGFDMRSAKLKAKQEELAKVRGEFQARITQIQREINELQAIEMEAA